MPNTAIIYLVQPLNRTKYKEMIVYADNAAQARSAASREYNSSLPVSSDNPEQIDTTYMDEGMSICIQIEPNVISADPSQHQLKIKYNEIEYELVKNQAEEVIAERIL